MRRTRRGLLTVLVGLVCCGGDESPTQPDPLGVAFVELSASTLLLTWIGETHQLTSIAKDQNRTPVVGASVAWVSSVPSVASVSDEGLVTAVSDGEATITATSGSVQGTVRVTVDQAGAVVVPSPTAVALAGPGDTVVVRATVKDSGGTVIANPVLAWSSDDQSVATISGAGVVRGIGNGSTIGRVTVAGQPLTGTFSITVEDGMLGGPAGASLLLHDAVSLMIPPGALAGPVFVTARPATGLPAMPGVVTGTAFEFGPDGLVFDRPATLTIGYEAAAVPSGVPEIDLRLHELVGNGYVQVPGGSVDPAGRRVSGAIDGFSVYAIARRLHVTTASLPSGVTGSQYLAALTAVGGGGDYAWSLKQGTLPAGLALLASGLIVGTPSASGATTFTVQVTTPNAQTATHELTIDVITPAGPVAHWGFSEGSGTTANDAAGPNQGVLSSGQLWAPGRITGGLLLDGVDDYVEVPDHGSLDITDNLTLSAWVNPRSLGQGSQGRIIDKAGSGSDGGYVLRVNTSARIGFQQGGQSAAVSSTLGVVGLNEWQHVVAVVSGGTSVSFFLDGVAVGVSTLSSPIVANALPLRLGIRHDGNRAFDGLIDEVRIYARALAPAEVLALYEQESAQPMPTPVPSVALAASSASILAGESSTLSWSSANATSCTASGGWAGSRPLSGSQVVFPAATTTYTLRCDGPGGSDEVSITVVVRSGPAPVPTVALEADPSSVISGEPSTLTWSSTDATSCTASGGWSGGRALSGSEDVTPAATTAYTLTCDGPSGGHSESATITVTAPPPPPTVTIGAAPADIMSGESSTLTWTSTDATGCTASGGWTGPRTLGGSQVVTPGATTLYVLTCDGPGGSTARSATVTVNGTPLPPTVTLEADPTVITSGGFSALTWSTADATTCTASGGWTGSKTLIGSEDVAPTESSTYTLACDGLGGSASESVSVTVHPVPVVTLEASPTSIAPGGSSTLTWSATDVTSCAASGGWTGTRAVTGSETVSPSVTTSYTLTCAGPGGSAVASVGVDVHAPPTVVLSANPSVIAPGASATLTWSSTDVTSCTASGGWIGTRAGTGSETVSPSVTTSYTLTCAGPGGSAVASVGVDVHAPPTVILSANLSVIVPGGSATLTWSSTNATSCTASGGWSGATSLNGSENVSPAVTSTFTLTCDGPGGSDTGSIIVAVAASYYPAPESSGGWRALVPMNTSPTPGEKAVILATASIDWDLLEQAYDYSQTNGDGTVLVIRNGWIVGEWGTTEAQRVASVTKSLTGLAVAKLMDLGDAGQLSQSIGLQSLAHQYLPAAFGASDPLKQQIRIEHLMTMSSGIEPEDPDDLTLAQRLGHPMDAAPATEWVYSSLPPNLLSMIVQDLSGQSLATFFNSRIASPIGAAPLQWETIDGGYTRGAAGASLNARDLARIAYLTLHDGVWDNGSGPSQVVSPARVAALTSPAALTQGITFRESVGSPFPLPADAPNHYGLLWWTNSTQVALGASVPPDAYYMHGCQDDLAIVVPSEDLIVVRITDFGPICTDPSFRSGFMQRVMAALVN